MREAVGSKTNPCPRRATRQTHGREHYGFEEDEEDTPEVKRVVGQIEVDKSWLARIEMEAAA